MTCNRSYAIRCVVVLAMLAPPAARAGDPIPGEPVLLETVYVGEVGNPASLVAVRRTEHDLEAGTIRGVEQTESLGSVGYAYDIGVGPVTVRQYAEFLNAVAATDDYGDSSALYYTGWAGEVIDRSGAPGSYSYSVVDGVGDRPIHFVTWMNAARFANWLHNGQPIGERSDATTESGSYDFAVWPPVRTGGATWVVPNEDEWYKAAYFSPNYGGLGSPGYFDYATGSDETPVAEAPPGSGNSANYDGVVGSPTAAGAYPASVSYFGTRDQTANLWEYVERVSPAGCAYQRGGSYTSTKYMISSGSVLVACIGELGLDTRTSTSGFRLVYLEPVRTALAPLDQSVEGGMVVGDVEDVVASDNTRALAVGAGLEVAPPELVWEMRFDAGVQRASRLDVEIETSYDFSSGRLIVEIDDASGEPVPLFEIFDPSPIDVVHRFERLRFADFVGPGNVVTLRLRATSAGCVDSPCPAIAVDRVALKVR